MNRVVAILLLAAACCAAHAQSPKPMLIDVQASDASIGAEQQRLQASDPSIDWIMSVRTDASLLGRGTVAGNLFDRQVEITFQKPLRDAYRTWSAEVRDVKLTAASSPGPNAYLHKAEDGSLGGYLNIDGYLYRLQSIDGRQMLIKRSIRRLDATPDKPLFDLRAPVPPLRTQ